MTDLLEAYVAQIVRQKKEKAAARAAAAAATASEEAIAATRAAPALFVNNDPIEPSARAHHSHFSYRGATLTPGQFQAAKALYGPGGALSSPGVDSPNSLTPNGSDALSPRSPGSE